MSSRAASSGGFWAARKKAAADRYGSAVTALAGEDAGMKRIASPPRPKAGADPAVQVAALKEPVADRAARQNAGERADADHEQEQIRERLVDPVLLA